MIGGNRLSGGFLATLVGTGGADGRGYAVITVIVGVLTIVIVLLAGRRPSLRYIDTNLPDVTAEDLLRRRAPLEPGRNGLEPGRSGLEPQPNGVDQQQAAYRPANAAQKSAAGEP